MNFKSFYENLFDDDFDVESFRKERKDRGSIINKQRHKENDQLILYHGFDKDPQSFNYEFDPSHSDQGLLWFTHKMISYYDPYEYASGKGKYVLTYPLPIQKIYDTITYQNGSTKKEVPEELRRQYDPTSNSRIREWGSSIISLPENWFFTYKTEKFIGTNKKITARPEMVSVVGH